MSIVQMTGQKIGRWTILGLADRASNRSLKWHCQCDCGSIKVVIGYELRSNRSQSCGCLNRDNKTKHGMYGTPTYNSWMTMIQRCTNPNDPYYRRYGGRGITISPQWRNSFEAFLADMGTRPAGMTLDRFPDNDGNYEPNNCRWATPKMQANNRRKPTVKGAYQYEDR